MSYIGIDLHSDRFTVNYYGEKLRNHTYYLDKNKIMLEVFSWGLKKEDVVAVEASTNTFAFRDVIKDKVKEVYVVNPLEMRIINDTGKKTDKVDAKKLSKLLKYHEENDKDFLPLVYVPEKGIRELRSLFKTYELYKKVIVMMKNRIHSLLKQELMSYRGKDINSRRVREDVMKLEIEEVYKKQIEEIYKTIDELTEKKEEIKKKILLEGKRYKKDIEILTTIDGIGVFVALGLIADYADIKRFKNAKKFSSYLRSVPRVDASNETVHIGKTKKRGRKLAIGLLLQSLYHVVKRESKLREFYIRKQKGKSKGKVRMAVVRKLFVIIYYMLKRGEKYRYMNEENYKKKMREYERFLKKYEKN